jgi:Uma2 family endonuclease
MSVGAAPRLMTVEEFEALPDDGVERVLIRGELREYPMTMRNQLHSVSTMEMGHALLTWVKSRPKPWGRVVGGEAGFVLSRDPASSVGVDVAYISAERLAKTSPNSTYFEGPPNVAVEILSPSDQQADILAKIAEYLDSGVELVLVLEPVFRTVTAYRPGSPPQFFTSDQDLTAEDVLPGFCVRVGDLFA